MLNFLNNNETKKKIKNIGRIMLEVSLIFFFFIILGLLNKNFLIFSKEVHFSYEYPDNKIAVQPLSPLTSQTYISQQNGSQAYQMSNQYIDSEVTLFSLSVPKHEQFSTATVKIAFNPNDAHEIQIGPKIVNTKYYNYQTIYNRTLENFDWAKITDGTLSLWQKNETFESIELFLIDPPKMIIEEVEVPAAQDTTKKAQESVILTDKIFVTNNYSAAQPLVATTRFISPDGELFRLSNFTTVPAKESIEVEVRSDQPTTLQEIPEGRLSIPGLSEDLQQYIYGEKNITNETQEVKAPAEIIQKEYDPVSYYYSKIVRDSFIDKVLAYNQAPKEITSTPFIEAGVTAYISVPSPSDLQITITKYDLNVKSGPESVKLTLYNSVEDIIEDIIIPDDGNTDGDAKVGPLQTSTITVDNIKAGIYKIDGGKNDAVIKIDVNQPYLVIENDMMIRDDYLGEDTAPYALYTNARKLQIPDWYIEKTNQTISLNNKDELILDSSRAQSDDPVKFNLGNPADTFHTIQLEKNFFRIENRESEKKYFSFSKSTYFNPDTFVVAQFNPNNLTQEPTTEYIVTDYVNVKRPGDQMVAKINFNLKDNVYFTDDIITFSLYAPNLEKINKPYQIISLDVVFKK